MKLTIAGCWRRMWWLGIVLAAGTGVSGQAGRGVSGQAGRGVTGQAGPYDPDRLYPADSLKADLYFFKARLEKMHPGLYRYSSRIELDGLFESLERRINRPMNEQHFLSLIMLVQARIRNGHTMILPGADAMAWHFSSERFLPFEVRSVGGRLVIGQNWSADSSIERGTVILRINGVSAAEVWRQLMVRQIRDGYNQTYPAWILDHYFAPSYSFVYGCPAEFQLELRGRAGDTLVRQVRALRRDSMAYFRRLRYGHPDDAGQGIVVRQCGDEQAGDKKVADKKAAVLTIRSFDLEMLKSKYRQDYSGVLDSVFRALRENGDTGLILDLRDNQGGDFPPVRYLLGYLVIQPTQFLLDGVESELVRPRAERFAGRLVVLINGGSFSSTAMLAATLQHDRRAVFIGEETGGNSNTITGDPEEVVLPYTKLSCLISTRTYRITPGVNRGHGVIPDYPVGTEWSDWLAGKDRPMEMAKVFVGCGTQN